MKVFLSFRFSGEDMNELEKILHKLVNSLKSAGHDVYCSFWDEDFFQSGKMDKKQIFTYVCARLDDADVVLDFIKTEDISQMMLMEIGYAYSQKKPLVVAIKNEITSRYIEPMANKLIRYDSYDELAKTLSTFDFTF